MQSMNAEILVVEDSRTQAEVLRHLLRRHGYSVTVASDGRAGLAAARQRRPLLVISDVEMPIMGGYEMCRAMKDDADLRDVSVLLLTSLSDADDVLRGLASGADYYLTKPYNEQNLIAQVEAALASAAAGNGSAAAEPPLVVHLHGRPHTITASRQQILNLLLSTYANAVDRNRELIQAKAEISQANQELLQQTAKLRQSEERYRAVVQQSADAIYLIDADSRRVIDANAAFQELLGYSAEEMPMLSVYDFVAHDRADIDARLNELSNIEARMVSERKYRRKDGSIVDVEVSAGTITYSGRRVVCTIARDMTERRRAQAMLEEQNRMLDEAAKSEHAAHEELKRTQSHLIQSEKLVGLGQMVAGIAHEINNPLAFVSNNVVVLRRDVASLSRLIELYQDVEKSVSPQCEMLTQIHDFAEQIDLTYTSSNLPELLARSLDGLKRIQQIVKDLRDFARLDESDLSAVDLNNGVESTVNIIRNKAIDKNVAIELKLSPVPLVNCYPAKVNQVIMNLLANAIDATPPGGKVTVRTDFVEDEVLIEVCDTGTGVDPSIRERIFDPFFTTKPIGQGTGLGLSVSYSIVRDHGGRIDVGDSTDNGARFTVRLPLKAQMPAQAAMAV